MSESEEATAIQRSITSRRYGKPTLRYFGSVRLITLGSPGPSGDSGGGMDPEQIPTSAPVPGPDFGTSGMP